MLRITETPVNSFVSFREIQIIFRHDWSWTPPYFVFVINEIASAFVNYKNNQELDLSTETNPNTSN